MESRKNRVLGSINQSIKGVSVEFKNKAVYKLYWGRSSLYRSLTHLFIILITLSVVGAGIYSRFNTYTKGNVELGAGYVPMGSFDLIQQGGNTEALMVKNSRILFNVYDYTVLDGDNLNSIAEKFSVSKDTVKWANTKIDYYNEVIIPGDKLRIPEINGVLYEVKEGDSIDSIVSKTSGDKFIVAEINYLEAPEYALTPGSKILIPDGKLPPPPPPPPLIPYQNSWRVPTHIGENLYYQGEYNGIPLVNPLSNPDCAGYVVTRGWGVYADGFHNGLDLAKYGGCPLRSVAAGTVISSDWNRYGGGYTVVIDHGAGMVTQYLHGETLWVRAGDQVYAGQEIMYMGETGNATGIHLHLTLKISNTVVDAASYIPH